MVSRIFAFWVVVLLVASSAFGAEAQAPRAIPRSQEQIRLSFAPIAARAAPAVVNVYAERVVRSASSPIFDDPFFRRFFNTEQDRVQRSLGSGVIVREDGLVVTNFHVVNRADALKVVLADRREFPAAVLIADERTDLAVLRIEGNAGRLPILPFANTRTAEVGDLVLAIGNPFGVGQTVTSGIISALARTDVGITDYSFFIQTDAAINPGNSGGALVDVDGRLVGVNTAIYSRDGGSNGIGFAIPAEMVQRVVESAVQDGKILRPWLGVKAQPVGPDIARSLALATPQGVIITEVFANGPAAAAGIRRGDVVLTLDDEPIFDEQGLRYLAATKRPGAAMTADVLRSGQRRALTVKVTPPPETPARDRRTLAGPHPFDGAVVVNLSPAMADELGLDPFISGVYVAEVTRNSPAARVGLRVGDRLLAINARDVANTAALEQNLRAAPADGVWGLAIERQGKRLEERFRYSPPR